MPNSLERNTQSQINALLATIKVMPENGFKLKESSIDKEGTAKLVFTEENAGVDTSSF